MDDTGVGCGRAAEDAEQAGLAGAVPTDEPDLVAGADGEAHVLHEETAGYFDREPAHLQHGAMLAGSGRRVGTSSVDLAVAALPVVGAELELLQLAGRGSGQCVAEVDGARALEVGEM